MSDECDLEELTAFLEASDAEEGTEEQACTKDVVEDLAKSAPADSIKGEPAVDSKNDVDDECDLDEIEAFLQASDDDEEDYDDVKNDALVTKKNKPIEPEEATSNIESKDAAEYNLTDNEMEFEDFEEGDFRELESMLDSQNAGTIQTKSANRSASADDIEAQSWDDENEDVSGEVNRGSDGENDTDKEESDSESELKAHELIEAEMAAMAKRMKELKSMLKQSKSSPGSCKKKPKSSSDSVEKKSKAHSERKSKTSPHSVKKHSKSSLDSSKNQSKSVADCDKNSKTAGTSSLDSLKKQIDKHKSFSVDKGKKSSSDRHFSDIASGTIEKTSPSSKVKDRETVKQKTESKQRSKMEQGMTGMTGRENQAEIAITINHPQQLLMMGISKDLGRCRGTTKAGQPCSSFINKKQGEFCTYHVQSAYRKSSSKRTELQASTGVTPKAFSQQKNKNAGSGCFFYGGNTYTTQRPQAKSSKDTMTLKKLQSFDARKAPGKITTMSLHDLEPSDEKKIDKLREKDKDLLKLLSVPSAGSMNFVKHLVKKDANPTVNKIEDSEVLAPSVSAKDLLKQHSKTLVQKKKQVELLSGTPTLGKGFSSGQDISLDAPIKKGKGCASAELAKQLAIAKVKSKGGINKEDPNAVRKKVTSPEAREKIRKRVAEDMDEDNSEEPGNNEPPKKKSKLLGDLDLNSPEVQKLLKKKSKHKGALAEAEAEHEDRYFSALEKKEQMEDKMGAIIEVPVKLFVCLQCKYRYFSVHERCKKEHHSIKEVKGVKRFFKCKHCKRRTVSIDRLPNKPCKDCGESSWERVSMLKERSGPKLESEELCLRGNEQKFIGSLQGKASFSG
ncbi:protein MCM10 homolog [Mercenaria mercenaria]|uniref:protein MCM10 homolog n=1 Tax=Mercenaria mercenaria TaxID=6596 RepID=UPI00234F6050|nr:protein MCM10 homolog [Mercenaria mercenaria]